ncbi:MAG: hypothetical protein KY456_15070 [Chloroflexi bacterium]|nr:hypothetical protein [Chloroflexota bacterium]
MDDREPRQVALRTITLVGERWADESPGDVELAIGDMIRTSVRGSLFGGLLVRVHPDAWEELQLRIANARVRWPAIAVVPVMCNHGQDPKSVSLSNVRLGTDVICMVGTE